MSRLTSVSDEEFYVNRLYPLLTVQAGEERSAYAIIMMLQYAIIDFTAGMSTAARSIVYQNFEQFIDALVINGNAAAETKSCWHELQRAARALA